MCSNNEVIKTTKEMFNSKFDMKDLGVVDVILGIKISKKSDGLILSQSHYIEKILKKFKQDDSSPMRTPVDVNLHLSKNNGKCLSQQEYTQAIGSLMYVINCTRSDIAYAVSKLRRYTSNPGPDYWKAIVRVLRYLKYTQNYGLHYSKYSAVLEGYCDANWISDTKDSNSKDPYLWKTSLLLLLLLLFFFFSFSSFLGLHIGALKCETKNEIFLVSSSFILNFSFYCNKVLQLLTICISISHYFSLASNLINL